MCVYIYKCMCACGNFIKYKRTELYFFLVNMNIPMYPNLLINKIYLG